MWRKFSLTKTIITYVVTSVSLVIFQACSEAPVSFNDVNIEEGQIGSNSNVIQNIPSKNF